VHNFVTVPAGDGRAFEALDFVARLLAHVPDPRRHLVHYYGAYSNVVRGKLKARGLAQKSEPLAPGPGEDAPPPACTSPSLAALRRGWAQLLRRVYEVDPLVCPRCRGVMQVVSFITEAASSAASSTTLAPPLAALPRNALHLPQPQRFPIPPDLSAGRGRRQRPGAGGRAEACLGHARRAEIRLTLLEKRQETATGSP
jgi:Putative transposase